MTRKKSNLSRISNLKKEIIHIENVVSVDKILKEIEPEIVIHAATCYGREGESMEFVNKVNFLWPKDLLNGARENKTKLFINFDTSLPPNLNYYSRTKYAFYEYLSSQKTDTKLRILNLRLESIFGEGDNIRKFPTMLLRALLRNDDILPLTLGKQLRDFIYIDDAIESILRIIEYSLGQSEQYIRTGVGTGSPITIREYATTLKQLIGSTTCLKFGALQYRENELMYSAADVRLLRRLGWVRKWNLIDAMVTTIEKEKQYL